MPLQASWFGRVSTAVAGKTKPTFIQRQANVDPALGQRWSSVALGPAHTTPGEFELPSALQQVTNKLN